MINNKAISKWFSMLLMMLVAGITGATAQSLSIGAVSIKAGETAEVTVSLAGGPIYGIQTDIVLPAGLTVVANSIVSLQEGVSVDGNVLASGNYRVAVLSMPESGSATPIADGEVFKLTVQAAADFAGGSISLIGTELTTTSDGKEVIEVAAEAEPTVEVTVEASAPEAPVADVAQGQYTESQTVMLTCATPGASIYYTLDGTTPTAESTLYEAAIIISESAVLKAIAIKDGVASEAVTTVAYDILEAVPEGLAYYWKGYSLGAKEVGGTIAHTNGTDNRLNYLNSGYYTICLNGKKANISDTGDSNNASRMVLTLNEPLKAGDVINITAYVTNAATKKASAYMKFDKGGEADSGDFGDEANINAAFNGAPVTKSIVVPAAAAGSTTITMTRGNAGTNLFITELQIIPYVAPAVVSPAFSPAAGTYTGTQIVALSCTTEGAAIYYTTDGTDPSADNGTLYSEAITVDATMTIKAIAIAGDASSEIVTAAYTIEEEITGERELFYWNNYTAANEIALTDDVTLAITGNASKTIQSGSSITIDGTKYTSFKLSNGAQNTLTLAKKAKAIIFYSYVNADNGDSYWKEVAGVNYDAETSGGVMASFKDGVNPDKRTYKLETPTKVITFNNAGKQLCYVMEVVYSDEVDALAAPTFLPEPGEYTEAQTVTLSCETEGAAIYYTTDGTEPTAESTEYTEAITVSETTTIKAIAIKDGVSSEVAEATYTIQGTIISLAITKLGPESGSCQLGTGTKTALNLYVQNNGNTPTNDFIVNYYKNDDAEPFKTVDFKDPEVNIPPIAVGATQNYKITIQDYLTFPGEYTLRAELVSEDDITPDDNVGNSSVIVYMPGDANVNGEITTSDAVATVSYVLNILTPDKVQKLSANVDNNSGITVTDAEAIVNMALNVEPEPEAARSTEEGVNYLTMDNNEIGLVNTTSFGAFQMDVTLSDGAVLQTVRLSERTAGMLLMTNQVGVNTWRIVVLSLDGSAIRGSEGSLLSLDIVGQGSISVSNVEFADRAANAYELGFVTPTGISTIYNNKVDGEVYTVSGTRTGSMKKGVNVVRQADGSVRKVLVK